MFPLDQLPLGTLLDQLAAKSPVPGGGAVAGVVAALAASLGGMVVSFSLGRKSLAPHQPLLESAAARLLSLRHACLELGNADAVAYERLNSLQKLSPDHPDRVSAYSDAVNAAIDVPMRLAVSCESALTVLGSLAGTSNPYLKSDLAIAGVLALAGAEAARWNVLINLREIADDQRRSQLRAAIDQIVSRSAAMKHELDARCE